jgi:hypothetical protein
MEIVARPCSSGKTVSASARSMSLIKTRFDTSHQFAVFEVRRCMRPANSRCEPLSCLRKMIPPSATRFVLP